MVFLKEKIKSRYWTYNKYLEDRCEALPKQIERKFHCCEAFHEHSTSFGMSNYIGVQKLDGEEEIIDSITIRISDHSPTGSGSHCDAYVYITGRPWADIKSEVMKIISDFMRR